MKRFLIIMMVLAFCLPASAQVAFNNVKIGAPVGIPVNDYKILENVECAEAITAGDLVTVSRYLSVKGAVGDYSDANIGVGMAMSDDGNFLGMGKSYSTGNYYTFQWSIANSRYEITATMDTAIGGYALSSAISSDGSKLLVGSSASPFLQSYTWSSGNNRYEKDADVDTLPTDDAYGVAISDDGLKVVAACKAAPYVMSYTWSSGNNRYEADAAPDASTSNVARSATMSSDGSKVAICYQSSPYLKSYTWSPGNNRYEADSAPDTAAAGYTQIGGGLSMSADGTYLIFGTSNLPRLSSYMWSSGNNRYEKISADIVLPETVEGSGISNDGSKVVLGLSGKTESGEIPVIQFKWNATSGEYEQVAYPDFFPVSSVKVYGTAMDGAGSRFSITGEIYQYTYTFPDTETTMVSLAETNPYAIPNAAYAATWQLYGLAAGDALVTESINVNALWWFNSIIDAELVSP